MWKQLQWLGSQSSCLRNRRKCREFGGTRATDTAESPSGHGRGRGNLHGHENPLVTSYDFMGDVHLQTNFQRQDPEATRLADSDYPRHQTWHAGKYTI